VVAEPATVALAGARQVTRPGRAGSGGLAAVARRPAWRWPGLGPAAGLFDPGSARPLTDPRAGPLTVTGLVNGVPVVAFSSGPAGRYGPMTAAGCEAALAAYRHALAASCPVVGLWQSAGTARADGMAGLHGAGAVFAAMTRASGKVPQLSVVLGPTLGDAACGPALADLIIIAPAGHMYVCGPAAVRAVTGEDVSSERLGGADVHASRSGVGHLIASDPAAGCAAARQLVTLLGSAAAVDPARAAAREFAGLLPSSGRRAYDARQLVHRLTDAPATELQPAWAPSIVTALGRLGGGTVGVLANNPLRLGGCLNSAAAEKAARFVRMCDSLGIPLVVLVDVPGYVPGLAQEWDGVVRRGAKLLHAFAEAVVPRVTVVTRKAYGGAYIAMNSRALGASRVFAWPGAEIAVMGALAAVRILHRRELADTPPGQRAQVESELAAAHERQAHGMHRALAAGIVDEVIDPDQTREKVAQAIATAPHRRGRHANLPL
jgi:acetyl-CoA/propionyl-CoA carboxylase carboxyl transferase subunit